MLEIMAYLCSVLLSPVFWTGIFSNVKHLLLISFRPRERERSTSQTGRLGAVREPHFRYAVAQYR